MSPLKQNETFSNHTLPPSPPPPPHPTKKKKKKKKKKNCRRRSHFLYRNRTISASLNLYVASMPPISFGSIQLTVGEEISFLKNFNAAAVASILDIWMILTILNLHTFPVPSTNFQLNPLNPSGADDVLRLSRWPQWRPSLISKRHDFSNSESPAILEEMSKIWKLNGGRQTGGRTADGRGSTGHGISWPGAKLIKYTKE